MAAPNAQNPADFATADKQKVMDASWYNSLFYSMTDTFKFIGGLMLAAGMAIVGVALKDIQSFSGIVPALSTSSAEVGLVFLGVAAASTAMAVTTQYISSRYHHSVTFDTMEANAKHTAKYIAQELKKDAACITHEYPQNQRTDGKSWVQATHQANEHEQQYVR